MSRYLGKVILEKKIVDEKSIKSVYVKYVHSGSGKFMFKCDKFSFSVGYELCYALSVIGSPDFQYKWSMGYVVRERKGIEFFREMRDAELDLLGGRKNLVLSGQLDNDVDFDTLCAIQYLYKFSASFLDKVRREWKRKKWGRSSDRWLELERRCLKAGGRKQGSKNKINLVRPGYWSENETVIEALDRCEHNKKVAVMKGYFAWFLEACREECKIRGEVFDKDECVSAWRGLRESRG